MDISSVLKNFQKQLMKINKKVLGYFYYDNINNKYFYDYAILKQISKPSIESIPFCFDPDNPMGPSVLKIGKLGYTTEKGQEINNIDEFIKNIATNIDIYLEQIEKKNPREFKEDYQFLTDFCYQIEKKSKNLYTELTTFTFPEPLLNTFRMMTLSQYENCGTINVSKVPARPRIRNSFNREMFPYDVIFHTDLPDTCALTGFGIGGDIHFHTHPVSYINPSINDKYKYLSYFFQNYHNIPSFSDINLVRDELSIGGHQIVLIFTYTGIYVFKYQQPVKEKSDVILNILTKDDETKFHINKWKCKMKPYLEGIVNFDIDEYVNYLSRLSNDDDDTKLNNEQKKKFNNMTEKLIENIKEAIPYPDDINNLRNIEGLLDKYPQILENMNKFCKDFLEDLLNKDNTSNNKITADFLSIQKDKEGLWNYPSFSVKLYPEILGFRGAFTTRRLTFQKP